MLKEIFMILTQKKIMNMTLAFLGGLRESGASVQPHVDGMATKQGGSIVCIITLGRTTLLTRFTATYEYFPTILRNVEGNLARRTGTLGIGQR